MIINVTGVEITNNPARFSDPVCFKISLECLAPGVQESLEWKVVFVGSGADSSKDQELENVEVGPVQIGRCMFDLEVPAPDSSKIEVKDLLEATGLLLTCSYKGKTFIRVGYWVYHDIASDAQIERDAEGRPLAIPEGLTADQLVRNIDAADPRVKRIPIPWDGADDYQPQTLTEAEQMLLQQVESTDVAGYDDEATGGAQAAAAGAAGADGAAAAGAAGAAAAGPSAMIDDEDDEDDEGDDAKSVDLEADPAAAGEAAAAAAEGEEEQEAEDDEEEEEEGEGEEEEETAQEGGIHGHNSTDGEMTAVSQ